MNTKYLILIIFGFILNKINAVKCADIDEGLAKLTVSKNKILILNTYTNKIIFFFINKKIHTLITNIGAYVYYGSCLDNTLSLFNIENEEIYYSLVFDRETSKLKNEDLVIDNEGSELKTNIHDMYKSVINLLNSMNGVKDPLFTVDQIKPLLNSKEKTYLHMSEDDMQVFGGRSFLMDGYSIDHFFSQSFFDQEDRDFNEVHSDPQAKDVSQAKRIKLTNQTSSSSMQGEFESSSKTNESYGRTSPMIDEELKLQKWETGTVAGGETNTDPSNSRAVETPGSSAEAVGSNPLETRFNEEIKNNDVLKISNISVDHMEPIKKIIRSLDNNQAIKLTLRDDYKRLRNFKELTIKRYKKSLDRSGYHVITLNRTNKIKDYKDQLYELLENGKYLILRFIYRSNKKKINLNNASGKQKYTISLALNGYDLYISTIPNTEKKINETVMDHSQEINYLNQKYSKNFISIIDDIELTHKLKISDLIHRLNPVERLIFIDNQPDSRKRSSLVRKIEIIKIIRTHGVDYYDVYMEALNQTEESFKNVTISVKLDRRILVLLLRFIN